MVRAYTGAGVYQFYRFALENDLRAGTLIEVLPGFGGCTRPFILLYPHARHLSSRVLAFVEFIVDRLGAHRTMQLNEDTESRARML